MRSILLTVFLVAVTPLGPIDNSCSAGYPSRPFFRSHSYPRAVSTHFHGHTSYHHANRHVPWQYGNVPPKFYGGFHYRELHNVGIPSGDIGLRGNGIYMTPW